LIERGTYDVAVIGAGVVGTAIGRQLARYRLDAVVLERANDVGTGTSKANTAILHTGLTPTRHTRVEAGPPWSRASVRLCRHLGIAIDKTGRCWWHGMKDSRPLDGVVSKAHANGYLPARRITIEELYRREPTSGLVRPGLGHPRRVDHLPLGARASPSPPRRSVPASSCASGRT